MGLIPEDIIAQVLERCDIVQTVSTYIPLKKAGRNFKAQCPFHNEKTPSFIVNPDKQIFHCFGCGVGGNAVTFVMRLENLSFPEAIKKLADKLGVVIPRMDNRDPKMESLQDVLYGVNELAVDFFHQNLLSGKDKAAQQARDYLKGRDFSLEIVRKFKLGFAPDQWDSLLLSLRKKDVTVSLLEKAGLILAKEKKDGFYDRFRNRIVFPILDIKARCVGFGARTLQEGFAKYINSPETPIYTKGSHLYGFQLAKEAVAQKDSVVVVEGYMDFIMPFQAGVNNIVASLGTALTTEQIRLLRRFTKNVVMLYDTDPAGESAMLRSLDMLIEEGMNVKVATLATGEDPDSFVRKFGVEKFSECIQSAKSLFDYKLNALLRVCGKDTVESRVKVATEMLPTINRFENTIIRSEYLRQLAAALSVSESALLVELKKIGTAAAKNAGGRAASAAKSCNEQVRTAEYNILKAMLENQELISSTKGEVFLSDFRDESIRKIIEKIYELYDQRSDLSPASLLNCFNDARILQIISGLLAGDDEPSDNIERMHRDCVKRLRSDRVRMQRQNLVRQIKEAEVSGNQETLERLTGEFNQLLKG
ncbi:MAG: DNA primase [Candidatus Omnitrophota bacterium]